MLEVVNVYCHTMEQHAPARLFLSWDQARHAGGLQVATVRGYTARNLPRIATNYGLIYGLGGRPRFRNANVDKTNQCERVSRWYLCIGSLTKKGRNVLQGLENIFTWTKRTFMHWTKEWSLHMPWFHFLLPLARKRSYRWTLTLDLHSLAHRLPPSVGYKYKSSAKINRRALWEWFDSINFITVSIVCFTITRKLCATRPLCL